MSDDAFTLLAQELANDRNLTLDGEELTLEPDSGGTAVFRLELIEYKPED